jgi:hypothetical protein
MSITPSILPKGWELSNAPWANLDALFFVLKTCKCSLYHMGKLSPVWPVYFFPHSWQVKWYTPSASCLLPLLLFFFFKLWSSEFLVQNAILTLDLSKISVIHVVSLPIYLHSGYKNLLIHKYEYNQSHRSVPKSYVVKTILQSSPSRTIL